MSWKQSGYICNWLDHGYTLWQRIQLIAYQGLIMVLYGDIDYSPLSFPIINPDCNAKLRNDNKNQRGMPADPIDTR
jgi:hypothetical protein